MKYFLYFSLIFLFSCKNNQTDKVVNTKVIVLTDIIPTLRSIIQKEPVASHVEKVPDELNDWQFAVHVYETKRRFHYIVRMQYKELRVTDSLSVPNIGIEPSVQIQKDSDPFSCTLGFPDKKGNFKPISRASIKNDRLRFKTVASYAVGVYRTEAKK
ncbi:MAG: hypothetical protein ACOYVG_02650 [Bacteroidota bacterium]